MRQCSIHLSNCSLTSIRFLESLSAKVHKNPVSADALSDLFQEFYSRASAHINTHIATLSSRISRADKRPGLKSNGSGGEQQLLTVNEVVDRKKARRQLEVKRLALEEAVERAVCEKVYDRIYRHRNTDDEERDHKLRSRTAAFALLGISLKELLQTAEDLSEEDREKTKEHENEIREWLSTARADILKMNEETYPLGKLQHLTAAHKSIVEALSKIFPATSSADEILPTLIYALITSPPDTLNIVSNLKFIQRFRGSSRVDGETAYCLVNAEAAVSFLETVDLSSLRASEADPNAVSKDGVGTQPTPPITPMPLGLSQAPDLTQSSSQPGRPTPRSTDPAMTNKAQRRLSTLIQTQTNRIEAASDAVRESIIDSADQALDTINNTLESSFKFLFGRMRNRDPNSPSAQLGHDPKLPKTLADVKKLVSSPPNAGADGTGDDDSVSAASSVVGEENAPSVASEPNASRPPAGSSTTTGGATSTPTGPQRMTDLFAGRRATSSVRQSRDRSADSTRSGGSSRAGSRAASSTSAPYTASSNDGKTTSTSTTSTAMTAAVPARPEAQTAVSTPALSAVDSIRNLGSSMNPLNRFALPRFGRSSTTPIAAPIAPSSAVPAPSVPASSTGLGELAPVAMERSASASSQIDEKEREKGVRAIAALDELRKSAPPVKKFLEARDVRDLRVRELEELLGEYQRLVGAVRGAVNYQ